MRATRSQLRAVDPLSLGINVARQYDLAIDSLLETIEMDPHFWPAYQYLGWAYEQKKLFDESIAELQKAVALSGGNTRVVAELAYTYAVFGKIFEARKVLDELIETSAHNYVSPYGMAVIFTGCGEKNRAFEWLHKAYEERSNWLIYLMVHPRFDSLRTDSRFTDLVRLIFHGSQT